MNIIHLINNKVWGGGERYALDLCRALRADGNRVDVFTRNKAAVRDAFADEGLLRGTLPMGGAIDIWTPIRLASFMNHIDGDVIVHVHNFKTAATALNARRLYRGGHRVKVVATRHLVRPASTGAAEAQVYAELDAIVFVSQLAMDTFLSSNPAVDRGKLHVVHNSVEAPQIAADSRRGGGEANIIYAGRIAPEKGLNVLLEALGHIAEMPWRLTVCGTGSEKDVMPLVRLARQLGIDSRVDWKGHVDSVAQEMAAADILVLPSVVPESFGLAALEGMAQGLPVVTTDNGAQREIVDDGVSGLLVPPSSPEALADALGRLIADPEMRRRMGEKGKEIYRTQLNYSRFYNDMLDIYHGV